MSLFKRLFSSDYRAALAAEAAGRLEEAAEHYALAGQYAEAARVHMARAERAPNTSDRITALRDALHWSKKAEPELQRRVHKHLGRALFAQIQAEGIATQRDRERVREAAAMLMHGGDYTRAGEAFDAIGATQEAVEAYSKGGMVERVESALALEDERTQRTRAVHEGFANYEMHMRIGDREAARHDLRACVAAADKKGEYRRLLDQLESRLISGGVLSLRKRQGAVVTAVAGVTIVMGRDSLCELPLRTTGISRRHAQIAITPAITPSISPATTPATTPADATTGANAAPRFLLRDDGSKNGTFLGGLPIQGAVPLLDRGHFALGEHCDIEYRVTGAPAQLSLTVTSGMDRGRTLIAAGDGEVLDLGPIFDVPVALVFRQGRPYLRRLDPDTRIQLNDADIAHGEVQLIHGDQLRVELQELEVL